MRGNPSCPMDRVVMMRGSPSAGLEYSVTVIMMRGSPSASLEYSVSHYDEREP